MKYIKKNIRKILNIFKQYGIKYGKEENKEIRNERTQNENKYNTNRAYNKTE